MGSGGCHAVGEEMEFLPQGELSLLGTLRNKTPETRTADPAWGSGRVLGQNWPRLWGGAGWCSKDPLGTLTQGAQGQENIVEDAPGLQRGTSCSLWSGAPAA